jgi:hypothetical protein
LHDGTSDSRERSFGFFVGLLPGIAVVVAYLYFRD